MQNQSYFFDENILNILKIQEEVYSNEELQTKALRDYTTFKSLQISDLLKLRYDLHHSRKNNIVWQEKILRFIEIKLQSIDVLLKLNYLKSNDREFLKIQIVSFLLESAYYLCDYRFLNTALKLLVSKNDQRSIQEKYNLELSKYLINKISNNE